jgi:hypothetical protein
VHQLKESSASASFSAGMHKDMSIFLCGKCVALLIYISTQKFVTITKSPQTLRWIYISVIIRWTASEIQIRSSIATLACLSIAEKLFFFFFSADEVNEGCSEQGLERYSLYLYSDVSRSDLGHA